MLKQGDLLRTFDGKYTMEEWWKLAEKAQRTRGKERLFADFIAPGSLVFDIGSSRGMMTLVFNWMGAEVVAVDPLYAAWPEYVREFAWKFGGNDRIRQVAAAVSDHMGTVPVTVHHNLPYLSSCGKEWMTKSAHARFYNKKNTTVKQVRAVTLDWLIGEFGEPDFVKLDVEGYGATAIQGLSTPIEALNFEFHSDWLHDAQAIMAHLGKLGKYVYSYALGNQGLFEMNGKWMPDADLLAHLREVLTESGHGSWGDIYGKLACDCDCCACDMAD